MEKNRIKKIVICGLAMAVIFIFTAFIAIPIGQFGYVNIGDSGILLFASILNPFLAFLVGGIGSALADLYLGYTQYALFTFLVKGLEGVIVSLFFQNFKDKIRFIGFVLAVIGMVGGYYLTDSFLYCDFIVALGGIGFNALQGFVSLVLSLIVYPFFSKYKM